MRIRVEKPEDYEQIRRVECAAFLNHPQHEPGALPTEHKIVESLRANDELTLSLVCEDEGEVVGHIAFSPVLTDGLRQGWWGLGPVAVRPDRQRKGIGSALISAGITWMREMGAAGIALVGEPEYYGKFGFKALPQLTLEGVPEQYFLCLPLIGEVCPGKVTFTKRLASSEALQ